MGVALGPALFVVTVAMLVALRLWLRAPHSQGTAEPSLEAGSSETAQPEVPLRPLRHWRVWGSLVGAGLILLLIVGVLPSLLSAIGLPTATPTITLSTITPAPSAVVAIATPTPQRLVPLTEHEPALGPTTPVGLIIAVGGGIVLCLLVVLVVAGAGWCSAT
jgi:hypothetical protein